ncbi:MAG: 50S ribosomal protein L17 [Alphaproteobacteria bacterium]|nr:MAG: 50S ribosomal protein L17 [Alphaproteobacteria bacterium]
MRHRVRGRKLNRTSSHRLALLRNMAVSLIQHKQIQSTLPKCKELRPFVEKLVTIARKNDLHARRLLLSKLGPNKLEAVNELMVLATDRYQGRPGGFTRILKNGYRYGDNAPKGVIMFVEEDTKPKAKKDKPAKPSKETAEKKEEAESKDQSAA